MTTTFISDGGLIGNIVQGLTGITGSLFLALLIILILLIVVALALNIPVEIISIIYLPIVIVLAAYVGDFKAMFGCILIIAGFILADKLFPKG